MQNDGYQTVQKLLFLWVNDKSVPKRTVTFDYLNSLNIISMLDVLEDVCGFIHAKIQPPQRTVFVCYFLLFPSKYNCMWPPTGL